MASSARIEELTRKFEENPRRYFAPLANEHRKAGDLARAIALCEAYLPQQPGHMSGHVVYGQALFEAGKLEESRAVFETALQLDPENLIALRYLGDIALQQGDRPGARQWYRRVLDTDPRNEEIQSLLAQVDGMRTPAGAEAVQPDVPATAEGAAELPGELPPAVIDAEGELLEHGSLLSNYMKPDRPVEKLPGLTEQEFRGASDLDIAPLPEFEATSLSDMVGAGPVTTPFRPTPSFSLAQPPAEPGEAPASFALEETPAEELEREDGMEGLVGRAPERSPFEVVDAAPVDDEALLEGDFDLPVIPPPAGAEPPVHAGEAAGDELPETLSFEQEPGDSAPLQVGPAEEELAPAAGLAEEVPVADEALLEEPAPAAFVTETMAELYLRQGHREEALDVYRQLAAQSPADERLRARVEELERSGEPTIRSFLAGIATRRPRQAAFDATEAVAGASGEWRAPAADELEPSTRVEVMGWSETTDVVAEIPLTPDAAPHREAQAAYASPEASEEAGAGEPSEAQPLEGEPSEAGVDEPELPGELPPAVIDAEGELMPDLPPEVPEADTTSQAAPAEAPRRPAPAFAVDESAVPFELPAMPAPLPAARPTPGPVDALFGNAPASEADTGMAATLAEAFAPVDAAPPLAGRPAELAREELSLDRVFRPEEGGAEERASGGFSFDAFFRSRTPHMGSDVIPPASAATPPGAGAVRSTPGSAPAASDADDIEQFNSWLQGLKKR